MCSHDACQRIRAIHHARGHAFGYSAAAADDFGQANARNGHRKKVTPKKNASRRRRCETQFCSFLYQSVRQLDGPYLVGVTSQDQMTVLAVAFQLGVMVTVMPAVPMMSALAPVMAI